LKDICFCLFCGCSIRVIFSKEYQLIAEYNCDNFCALCLFPPISFPRHSMSCHENCEMSLPFFWCYVMPTLLQCFCVCCHLLFAHLDVLCHRAAGSGVLDRGSWIGGPPSFILAPAEPFAIFNCLPAKQ